MQNFNEVVYPNNNKRKYISLLKEIIDINIYWAWYTGVDCKYIPYLIYYFRYPGF